MVKTGGLEGNPMMAGLADQLLEAAVAGEGGGGMRGSSVHRKANDKAKNKKKRKLQKQARRKSRK
jgi:hypothetical protein